MKSYHAIIVLLLLVVATALASMHSYRCAQTTIVRDMNRALALTLAEKTDGWITPDTIQTYRSHLQLAALRDKSYLTYAVDDRSNALKSRRMRGQGRLNGVVFQSYANCSMASVWLLSDYRGSLILALLTLGWGCFSLLYMRRHRAEDASFGGILYSESGRCFVNARHEVISLTPMQLQLMRLFFAADNHKLSKQQICDALWPKKPDASETFYTLIRRLKQVLAAQSRLQIVTERGKDYQLKEKK